MVLQEQHQCFVYHMSTNYSGIMLSKRANVLYLEHSKVILKDNVVIFLQSDNKDVGLGYNIPDKNTAFILLGKGTSITDAAVRKLSESNVIIGFCGSGGTPLTACTDITFFNPELASNPSSYIQSYVRKWVDDDSRLRMAKVLLNNRVNITKSAWGSSDFLKEKSISLPDNIWSTFISKISISTDNAEMMGHEGALTKLLYHKMASGYKIGNFTRNHNPTEYGDLQNKINQYLNYGHYLSYGYAAVVLNGLGLNHGLPLLHGMTRKDALIYDVADIIKDGYIMPFVFEYACNQPKISSREFRQHLINHCQKVHLLDVLFESVKNILEA